MSEKQDEDFISFEKALNELKMRSEELKKLVSEGEIRAFKDGASMKFRREDVSALTSKTQGEEELSFADSLEDDTGMVTEQISEEDTLLVEDEDVVEEKPATRRSGRSPVAAAVAIPAVEQEREPGWVTAVGVLSFLVLIWGFMITYSISREADPASSAFTSAFAKPSAKK